MFSKELIDALHNYDLVIAEKILKEGNEEPQESWIRMSTNTYKTPEEWDERNGKILDLLTKYNLINIKNPKVWTDRSLDNYEVYEQYLTNHKRHDEIEKYRTLKSKVTY